MKHLLVLFAVAGLLAGCSFGEERAAGEAAVAKFHRQYSAGKFQNIWIDAHEDFRAHSPEAEIMEFFSSVHGKLGRVLDTQTTGWNVTKTPGNSSVTLTQQTLFEKGEGTETFVFNLTGGEVFLRSYNINTDAFWKQPKPETRPAADES